MVIPAISRPGSRVEVDIKEFHAYCISLAKEIDFAIGLNEVPPNVQELVSILIQTCRRGGDDQTRAVIMLLMVSAKTACQLGWFPQRETQELLALADLMWDSFSNPENVIPSVNSSFSLFQQVLKRFYPFVDLGHIVLSFEAKPTSNIVVKDFHLSKKMLNSRKQRVGLFVVRTEDISKSRCIIHPQEVSFLLNGKGVEKRVKISMDSGPQVPTNVTSLLNPGANLLQTLGCFGGSYFIVIAFMDFLTLPEKPLLKDYVHSEVAESNSDCDIIEGASRISLSCPISRTRIKLPVKGHVCKHLQCFDFRNYVDINRRRPSWRCPHCNQSVCYTDIRVDQKMIKILEEVGFNAADVVISADGSWRVVTENDENDVDLVPETTRDPNIFLNSGPTVLDLTGDEDDMEASIGSQVNEQKPCLAEIQGLSNNTHNVATEYTTTLHQYLASVNALPPLPQTLNTCDEQQYMNLPQVQNPRDSAARQALPMTFLPPQDRLATNTASLCTSIPATPQSSQFQGSSHAQPSQFQGSSHAQSSQFQGSHAQSPQYQGLHGQASQYQGLQLQVTSLGHCLGRTSDLMERWNQIYGNGVNQTQMPPMPPLQHHYAAIQNQRVPNSNLSAAQPQRPISSFITHPQTLAVNYGGTTDQRPMPRPNHGGGAMEQLSSPEFMNLTSANWRRMRGSIMPGSTTYDQMMIRPTQLVQPQSQTIPPPPPQPIAYNNNSMSDEIQAFLAHPTYPTGINETQGGMGSMPVAEGLGAPASFWSMPPETW